MTSLVSTGRRTWQFEVIGSHHLDAPQKAKSEVASENDVDYHDLRARVVRRGHYGVNSVVVVAEVR